MVTKAPKACQERTVVPSTRRAPTSTTAGSSPGRIGRVSALVRRNAGHQSRPRNGLSRGAWVRLAKALAYEELGGKGLRPRRAEGNAGVRAKTKTAPA